jgi:hypothetical protein
MATAEKAGDRKEWLSALEAANILGVRQVRIAALGKSRHLTTKHVPGCRILYSRDSVEKLRDVSVTPVSA